MVGDGFLGGLRFFRRGGGVLVGAAGMNLLRPGISIGMDLRHNKFLLLHTVAALPDLVGSFFPEHDRACMLTMALWVTPMPKPHIPLDSTAAS